MTSTVADYLLQRLRDWQVDYVFGYAGDGINGLLSAWQRAEDQPRFIQARHEEMAALAATGYAKFSGRVGVCTATSGPGAIHLLNGLYDAKLDHVGVVAIVGQTARSAMGGAYQQEVDLLSLFKDVAGQYLQMVMVPEQLPNVLDRALRIASSERTVTAVIIPSDVQELEYTPPSHAFKMVPSSLDQTWAAPAPAEADLQRAADLLNAGSKVAMLIGQGARGAAEEVASVADVLGAGVAKALLGSVRAVQIDVDPTMVGLRYPFEVNLVGDAAETLRRLAPLLQRKDDRDWRDTVQKNVDRWWQVMAGRAQVSADPINPEQVFAELSPRLPEDAMITADSGSGTNWYARHVKMRGRMRGTLSGTLATMGCAVPYAIGAKFAYPDRPAYALVGDGAMQMNGINELITIAKYWHEWADPRLVVLVLHNNDLNQVTWELRAMGGSPQFLPSQELPDFDYAAFAQGIGLEGIAVDDPERVGPAWDEALAARRPCVIEFRTDPAVPPIPPHATWDQVINATESIVRGDSDRVNMIKEGVKSKLRDLLPGAGR